MVCTLPLLAMMLGQPVTALAALPQAVMPYQLTVFATSVPGVYSAPDSIAASDDRVYVGYGNRIKPDGSDGLTSTIVEYRLDGTVAQTFTVVGHNDGLKVDPSTGRLWALQNEDANPQLVIINPKNGEQRQYSFGPTLHGGGYDDIVFRSGKIFFSASNPSLNPNSAPAIVEATLHGSSVTVTPVVAGNSLATDISTWLSVALNLQDPDSMVRDPAGDLVLDSQADSELTIVRYPDSASQRVFRVAVTSSGVPTNIDDTVFATASEGRILVTDRDAETVYSLQKPYFFAGEVFSAANDAGFIGRLDLENGTLTAIVTGLANPRGMVFIGAHEKGGNPRSQDDMQ